MAALCALAMGAPAAAQEELQARGACTAGRITSVFVDNHSIYDLDALEGIGFLRKIYELANMLHVKTREGFIRREILFREGDCYQAFLLEESERILRSYGFIARADVYAVDQPYGNKHVVVDTQDEWTTRVDVGVSFDEGLQLERFSVTEENLLGQGVLGAVFLRQRRERQDLGARVELPRVFGSRTDVSFSAGQTRDGSFVDEQIAYPFVGEVGRFAFRQTYRRRDELFPYAAGSDTTAFSHLLLPFLDERVELSVAGRLGEPGKLTLLGLGLSRETLDFGGFPGTLEVAVDNDFGNPAPAPAGADALVRRQVNNASTTRVNLFIGQRNLRFLRVRGLDALDGVQDIQLGTDVGLTLGRSVEVLQSRGLSSPDDLYARLRFFAGHDPGTSFLFFNAGLEGRRVFARGPNGTGWRDVVGEADFFGYVRSRLMPGHTFFARVSAAGGWSLDTPFQLTLGGREALRGLKEEDLPGSRRLLMSLEDRIFVRWPAPQLFDLGITLFAEAGRMWGGEVPFGSTSGWKGAMGAGLRLGFPAGTRGVARLDLAFPMGMGNTRGPVFRVTLFEPLGLIGGFEDVQLERSRRITVGPDYFVVDPR
jgi:hypothetical protein